MPTIKIGGLYFTQWLRSPKIHGSVKWTLIAGKLRRARVGGDHCSASPNIFAACDVHDLGYDLMRWFRSSGPGGAIRKEVDNLFKNDMEATCRAGAWWKRNPCLNLAIFVYYGAVHSMSVRQRYGVPK